jgi:oligopeptide/dipeptide ABC transporter ATP-binding protein
MDRPQSSAAQPATLILPPRRVVQVEDLSVRFSTSERTVDAVRQLSFHVDRGETLAIVGESGSGKSVTSLALMRLVEHGGGRIVSGSMAFRRRDGAVLDLARAPDATMRGIRGADIAMIFQEPMTSLNPVFTAGEQIAESIRLHQGKGAAEAKAEALRMLELVRIPEARAVLGRYPHQLSGGMRQRVMIAMALACRPSLLIADEPTTALDVTVQAQIMDLLRRLREEEDMAVVLITHDLAVVAEEADSVVVMYAGTVAEQGPVEQVFASPRHPYTKGLLESVPVDAERGSNLTSIPGSPPELKNIPAGCVYQDRCPLAQAVCRQERPVLREAAPGQQAACHFSDRLATASTLEEIQS